MPPHADKPRGLPHMRHTITLAILLLATPAFASAATQQDTPPPPSDVRTQPAHPHSRDHRPDAELIQAMLRRHADALAAQLKETRSILATLEDAQDLSPEQLRRAAELLRPARGDRRGLRNPPRGQSPKPEVAAPTADHTNASAQLVEGQAESLSDDDTQLILAFLQANRPQLAAGIERARERSPERYQRFLQRHARDVLPLAHEWRDHPRLFELRRRAADAEVAARRAAERVARLEQRRDSTTTSNPDPPTTPTLARAREELALAVTREASIRIERARLELDAEEQRLAQRRSDIDARAANLATLIKERAEHLVSLAKNRPRDASPPSNSQPRRERPRPPR